MPFLLKPEAFRTMTSPLDVQKLMKQDIKNSVGKSLDYVAAKNIKIGSATVSLFVVTDNPKAWETVLKEKKPASLASGKCQVSKGAKIQVAIKSVNTGNREAVATLAETALKDPAFQAIDFAKIASDKLPGAQPSDKALDMVRRSYEQAKKEKRIDRDFQLTDDVIRQMAKMTNELAEYNKFASAFEEMAHKYDMKDYKKVPVDIWASLLQGLIKSGYFKDDIPKAEDGTSFILAYKGSGGKVMREKVLAEAMKGLQKFTGHAATYLDKVVAEVRKAGGTPTWSFWSGAGAQDAAKRENTAGVVLEGSVGAWFDKVWDFKALTGVENLALWTSLSELYAQKAAEYYDSFHFRGYVGQGATRDQSVFNKIEQPTFVEVLNTRKQVGVPQVDWFVVDCVQDNGRWKGSGNPSTKFASRDAALAEVTKRYGG